MPLGRSWMGILLAVLVVTSACFSRNPQPPEAVEPIVLLVENRHWSDVTISIVHDGVANRLGVATAAATAQFRLPPHTLGASGIVSFVADPVGATNVLRSETIIVKPGQYVKWSLERDLRRSSLIVQ
jgi:hypothetical protein